MGRAFSSPVAEGRGAFGNVSEFVITRVMDPDDEFAEHQTLVRVYDPASGQYRWDEFQWAPTGLSYDGNAVSFSSQGAAEQAVGLMLFGRDSVAVNFEL